MAKKTGKTTQERRQERLRIEMAKKSLQEQLEQADLLLQEENAPDEVDLVAAESSVDSIQKDDTYYSEPYMVRTGPVSFDELDAVHEAEEKSREIRNASWDVQDLVRNILYHPVMDAKEKATAIQGVGTGFEKRISSILSGVGVVQKDLDALSAESILAHDNRQTGFLGKIGQFIQKATLSSEARSDLPDSDFALVKDVDGKKVRKYPVHDASHTRNALARAAQEINAGGQAAVDAKEAMPRIRQAAKKFDIDVTMKKNKNAIVVQKDEAGDWRWIGWVSNNFEDTDHDIISELAHKEYVAYLDKNPAMAPLFMSWHTPGTSRENLPDFWDYQSGFLVMSGKLTEKEASALLNASILTDLGMSHLSLVLSRDKKDSRVITKYRMCEASDLPRENAANPFTGLDTLSKEADMEKLDYLSSLIGKDKAVSLLAQMDISQKELQDAGVVSKGKKEDVPATGAETVTIPEHVMKAIEEKLDIPGLNAFILLAKEAIEEKIPMLEGIIKAQAKDIDEQIAEKIAPPATTRAWSVQKARASEKDETVIPEDDKLLKNKPNPGENWLSEATGTKPVPTP